MEREEKTSRFYWPVHPVARPENVVRGDLFRFTVLTSRLLRLEYDPSGTFEDRASQMVLNRDFPVCAFETRQEQLWLTLETDSLVLRYRKNQPFAPESLQIRLKQEPASQWRYGEDFEDLGGTVKTLDQVDGACPLERGICSRNGFSVLDDSTSLVMGADGWVEVRREGTTDSYFFGYGFDYRGAVADFYRLTGAPTMLPAFAFGNWWSRYHAYTQQEYLDLMDRFREEKIPFAVSVVDMDWHVTKIPEDKQDENPGFRDGWTGYSWNRELFPDYKSFLKELKKRNLKVTLNLHPHAGVCRHEDMYPQMARACGIDPESGKRIPLDLLSQNFMEKYFDIIHHPYEEDGVDFWWMDWQQGNNYWWIHEPNEEGQYKDPRERVDPLWMLNHLHVLDISRDGKRPVFFSRYSGPGSQRYSVGFSGDSFVTWDSLAFQPYFTATASNIGYCWWSHDIGGHQWGWRDDELFARWVQLGVFSPINRLHSTTNEFLRKEVWCYGPEARRVATAYLQLRHSLFPYLYTMNERAHSRLEPLVQPMYYSYPKCSAAYEVPNQYWFGSELVVAPITEKSSPASGFAGTTAWLPTGDWFDFNNGLHYASRRGRKLKVLRRLGEMPVFAKAGAIVPMQVRQGSDNRLGGSEEMRVLVFPGADNDFALYEDSGDGPLGRSVITQMRLRWGETAEFTLCGAEGELSLIPARRTWHFDLRGFASTAAVQVLVDGQPVETAAIWNEAVNTLSLTVEADVTKDICLRISGQRLVHDNSDVFRRCMDVLQFAQIACAEKNYMADVLSSNESLRQKMCIITGRSMDSQSVVEVLRELLSLTEDEYLGTELRK